MTENIKIENTKKQYRRAKRTKKWKEAGNIIPLSTKEKKRIQNKIYRARIKQNKDLQDPLDNFNNNYQKQLNEYLQSYDISHTGCLAYRNDIDPYKAFKNAKYLFETLLVRGLIHNYFFVNEIQPNHNHTHYVIASKETTKEITNILTRLFTKYENGYNYIKTINCREYKENAINYLTTKLNPTYHNYKNQKQIDYWSININLDKLLNVNA